MRVHISRTGVTRNNSSVRAVMFNRDRKPYRQTVRRALTMEVTLFKLLVAPVRAKRSLLMDHLLFSLETAEITTCGRLA